MSKTTTIVRMGRDGRLLRKAGQGWEPVEVPELPASSDDEAALDPVNPPTTAADFARMKPVPRIKTLRRALMLTQEEFAARYHIPVGTLRDWEQGRTEPDAPARAYLKLIASDPSGVADTLGAELSPLSP